MEYLENFIFHKNILFALVLSKTIHFKSKGLFFFIFPIFFKNIFFLHHKLNSLRENEDSMPPDTFITSFFILLSVSAIKLLFTLSEEGDNQYGSSPLG